MAKKILLTGNTGYIGTVMAGILKDASYTVVGLDSGMFLNNTLYPVPEAAKPDRQIMKDIRSVTADDLEGIDSIVHLAGLSNDPIGELNPGLTDDINRGATVNLGKLARDKGIKRFVFASSCSIYGISDTTRPIDETGNINPLTAYAKGKVDAEKGLMKLAGPGFEPVLMRNATVYGLSPRLRLDLVVNNLLAYALLTGEISIMSDGTPWRPIIHIKDFCRAFLAALEAPSGSVAGEAFNVGTDGENYQVKEIASEIGRVVPAAKVKILNRTGGDDRSYRVDFSKIKRSLPGFKPQMDLKKGIDELLGAYREHGLTREDFESDKYFRLRTIKTLMASGKVDNDLRSVG